MLDLLGDPKYMAAPPKTMSDLQRRWDNELQGALGFIERLSTVPAADRLEWARKMRDHYILRCRDLLTKTPPGMQHRARYYKRLVKALTS